MGALVLVALVAGLTGCDVLGECRPRTELMVSAEGQDYRCVAAEDCPRASRETVCVNDVSVTEACIRCVDTRCVRFLPEDC
jgi:hypothetical protein